MGMDVHGQNPSGSGGKYFQCSVFNWPLYLAAMRQVGLDVPEGWSYNDGEGLNGAEECRRYADALEAKFDELSGTVVVLSEGNLGNKVLEILGGKQATAVTMDPARLRTWITFLRECGGFRIC